MKKIWKNYKYYIVIAVLTIISFILSIIFQLKKYEYEASIFSSLWTGMITGCVLVIISACKNRRKIDLKLVKNAYESIYDLNKEFIEDDKYLEHIGNYDALFESVYSKLSRLIFINQYIEKYTNKKLKQEELADNFMKEFNYNIRQKEIEYQGLHDNLQKDMYKTQRDLINLVRKYQKEILKLNLGIYNKIKELDNEIYKIDKSFI